MRLAIDISMPKLLQKRKYEAASKSKRNQGWRTGSGDANAQIKGDLATLRERSRDLRRNNPYAHRIVEVITNNVVGKGIMTDISDPEMNDLWRGWAESKDIDYDGRNTIKGLQRLIMDAVVESGEVLIRKRYTSSKKIPIQYQILEADFLDSTLIKAAKTPGNYVIQGIEFNPDGQRVGYHLHEFHPGSYDRINKSFVSNFIPADEIIHIFRQERPGQVRGVPWMAPSMMRLKDLDDYEDAQLMKQKVAACFTAFVHDLDGSVESSNEGTITEDESARIVPTVIEHLPSGKTITFANPPSVENYKEFTSSHLRAAACGVGLSYEIFGDLSEINFSSGRMGWLEMNRNVDTWRDQIIEKSFLNEAVADFQKMVFLRGLKGNPENCTFNHISPRREMIDPLKEMAAIEKQLRNGVVSRSEVTASLGRDPDEVISQIIKDNKLADTNGLIFDSDPRKVSQAGKYQIDSKGEFDGSSNEK